MSARIDLTQPPQGTPGVLVPMDERPDTPQEARQALISRQKSYPRLAQYLINTCDAIDRLDDAERLRIRKSQVRCCMYYDGRQYGEVRDDGEWYDYDRSPGDIRPVDNEYKKHVDKLNMEMDRGRTKLTVSPANPNDMAMIEGAQFLQARIDANRKRILNAGFTQTENMALLLKAITLRYTYFNPNGGPSTHKIPIIEDSQTLHQETPPICAGCSMLRNPALLEQPCAECGTKAVKKISAGGKSAVMAKEWQKGPMGRVETLHIDPLMTNLWLGVRHGTGGHENPVASSPFVVIEQMLFRCQIEQHYPDRMIPSTGMGMTPNDGARFAWDLERWPSNSGEGGILSRGDDVKGGDMMFERLHYKLYWLDPVIYSQYRGNYEETLPGGQKLPVGADITEFLPDGMLLARVENTVLDIQPEDKNKKFSMAPYGLREHALHGSGTNALLGPQDTINDLESYFVANIYYNMAPREFARKDCLEAGQLPAANEVALVQNVPEGQNIIGYAYAKAEGSSLPGEAFEFHQSKRGSIQEAAGTSSLSAEGSAPDVKAMGTATGVAAIRDQAVGRIGPPLRLKAAMDIEHGYQIGEHEQEAARANKGYFSGLVSDLPVKEKGNLSYSQRGLEAFMASRDLRADFIIEAESGSWMPRTEAEVNAEYEAFGQVAAQAGPLLGDPDEIQNLAEEMLSRAAVVFKQPLDLGGWTATERAAAERLTAVARTVRIMERKGFAMPDPRLAEQAIAITPGAGSSVEMDKHPAFIKFYKDWFVSDEGRRASKLLRLTIETMKQHHEDGWKYQLAQETTRDIAKNAPLAAAMEQSGGGKDDQGGKSGQKPPSQSMAYKDAPPSIRRQMEAAEGYTPATDDEHGAEVAAAGEPDDGTAGKLALAETTAQHKLAVQTHAAEMQQDTETHKAKLTLALQAHKAETEAEMAAEQHERETAAEQARTGQERVHAMIDRGHEEKSKAADRNFQAQDKSEERKHQTSLARIKTAAKPQGGKK